MIFAKCQEITIIKKHAVVIAGVLLYIILLRSLHTTCLVLWFTGHSCPCCGSTRALLALLNGNVAGYFSYNPFALPLGLSLICMLHLKFFKHKKTIEALCLAVAVGAFARWIVC